MQYEIGLSVKTKLQSRPPKSQVKVILFGCLVKKEVLSRLVKTVVKEY